jgi:acyl carrier protein
VSRKIRKVRSLEEAGAEVLVFSADSADLEHMRTVIEQSVARLGPLNGVIHAAGIMGDEAFRLVAETGRTDCERQFGPKVKGLSVLKKVLEGRTLDFCLLTSSLSSILGGLGFTGYSAANLFMDAFASRYDRIDGTPWISVNWDAWRLGENLEQDGIFESNLSKLAITPDEGADVFRRILSMEPLPQVVISTGNLQARIDQWIGRDNLDGIESSKEQALHSRHARVGVSAAYIGPRNEIERAVADIWQDLLNVEKVGVHDNFFELGGHSLLGTQVISRVFQRFHVQLSLRKLFEGVTVEALAGLIETSMGTQKAGIVSNGVKTEDREVIEI